MMIKTSPQHTYDKWKRCDDDCQEAPKAQKLSDQNLDVISTSTPFDLCDLTARGYNAQSEEPIMLSRKQSLKKITEEVACAKRHLPVYDGPSGYEALKKQ